MRPTFVFGAILFLCLGSFAGDQAFGAEDRPVCAFYPDHRDPVLVAWFLSRGYKMVDSLDELPEGGILIGFGASATMRTMIGGVREARIFDLRLQIKRLIVARHGNSEPIFNKVYQSTAFESFMDGDQYQTFFHEEYPGEYSKYCSSDFGCQYHRDVFLGAVVRYSVPKYSKLMALELEKLAEHFATVCREVSG